MTKEEMIVDLENKFKSRTNEDYQFYVDALHGKHGTEWKEAATEFEKTHNKYGVPYHPLTLFLCKKHHCYEDCGVESGLTDWVHNDGKRELIVEIDIGSYEDWGNVQDLIVNDKDRVCWGCETDFFVVKKIVDEVTNETITGKKLRDWVDKNIWKWIEWYSE